MNDILDPVPEATTYKEVIAATSEPTGFQNSDDTDNTLSFDDGTRTFTITPVASLFEYWIAGVKYTQVGADSLIISDVEGVHFIFYDGSVLSEITTFDSILFTDFAYVAAVYWDATNNTAIYLGNERHGIVMDGDTHTHFHEGFGTRFESGLALGDILADESGALDTHAQLSVETGEIHDEDIELLISALSAPAQIPVYYKDGADGDWRKFTATDFPVRTFPAGSNLLAWNEFTGGSWQQTEATNNKFVLTHIFATNDINTPIIVVQGEAEYTNQNSARTGATVEINSLVTAGLPFEEFIPIATVIFQTNTGYANSPKARIRSTDLGDDYVDWRFSGISPSSVTSSHPNLSKLNWSEAGHTVDTDIDFQQNKAIAMVCDNGATFPTSGITTGQWFLHTPTGRKILYQYDSDASEWKPIISYGSITLYVDATDGTDDMDGGTAVDSDAFATIQFAIDTIPGLVGGDVIININNEIYTENVIIQGKAFTTTATITLQGTLNLQVTAAGASVVAGSGATQGTVTAASGTPFGSFDNMLSYLVTDDLWRVIDSDTTTVLTCVATYLGATATQNVEVYNWGTEIDGTAGVALIIASGQKGVVLNDIFFDTTSTTYALTSSNASQLQINRCKFASGVFTDTSSSTFAEDTLISSSGTFGFDTRFNGTLDLKQCKVDGQSGSLTIGIEMQDSGFTKFARGSIIDGCVIGMRLFLSKCKFGGSASRGYERIRNSTTGINATNVGFVVTTTNTQYSGNGTDENPSGASNPAFID